MEAALKKTTGRSIAKRPVIKLSMDGEELARYESINAAAKAVGGQDSGIHKALDNPQRSAYGFRWKSVESVSHEIVSKELDIVNPNIENSIKTSLITSQQDEEIITISLLFQQMGIPTQTKRSNIIARKALENLKLFEPSEPGKGYIPTSSIKHMFRQKRGLYSMLLKYVNTFRTRYTNIIVIEIARLELLTKEFKKKEIRLRKEEAISKIAIQYFVNTYIKYLKENSIDPDVKKKESMQLEARTEAEKIYQSGKDIELTQDSRDIELDIDLIEKINKESEGK